MNQGFGQAPVKGGTNPKIQSFLEALRNSQGKFDAQTPDTANPFAEFQYKKEIEKKRIESFHKARAEEWNRIYSAKQKEIEKKIEQIREELKKLAARLKNLDSNVTAAVQAPVVEAGEYHLSFLEHIREVIHDYSLKVSQADSWLEVYNKRSRKKGFYWGQAQKRGTSYTLNNERTVATSVG